MQNNLNAQRAQGEALPRTSAERIPLLQMPFPALEQTFTAGSAFTSDSGTSACHRPLCRDISGMSGPVVLPIRQDHAGGSPQGEQRLSGLLVNSCACGAVRALENSPPPPNPYLPGALSIFHTSQLQKTEVHQRVTVTGNLAQDVALQGLKLVANMADEMAPKTWSRSEELNA